MKLIKIAMLVVALILLAQPILAIGVSPARSIIDFEPGVRKSVTIKVVNNEHKDFKAIAFIKGELANYTNVKETLLTVTQHEDYKELTYEIILPNEMKVPGTHTSEIVILEFPKEFATTDTAVVSSSASVIGEIKLRVPYPDKYAEAQLHISNEEQGVRFVIPVWNYGSKGLQSIKARIRVLGATYEQIALLETDEISLEPKKEGKLVALWVPNVNPGVYHAVVEVDYDGKKIDLEQNFEVGNLLVDIESIKVSDYKLGGIARFDIFIKSNWNQPIDSIYADMTVLNKDQEISSFKTAQSELPALKDGKLEAYWDTNGVSVGKYDAKIVLNYAGRMTEKVIELDVNIDSIRTGLTTGEVTSNGTASNSNNYLIMLVIVMVIINVGWLIYIRRIKK